MLSFERNVVACISAIVALFAVHPGIEGVDAPESLEDKMPVRQPDYAKWMSVKKGDGEVETRGVLGQPLDEKIVNGVTFAVFGRISYPTELFPKPFEFVVLFRDGRVMHKSDPFSGRFSTDAVPTTPVPVDSDDIRVFDHYPRFVDLR